MNEQERHPILTVCLLAAFADGRKDHTEREQILGIARNLGGEAGELPLLYQQVLLNQVTLEQACDRLTEPTLRQLAYEMAVCICDSDGACNAAEREFLERLSGALGLDSTSAVAVRKSADALAEVSGEIAPAPRALTPAPARADSELDPMILHYSILNGALELLPDSLATMAIIPLQLKMVYRVGKHFGHELDRGHIKEFLATAGVGLTSQVLETYASKLLRGLLGGVAGGLGRMVGSQAASSAMSFATTYALGHAAKRYYEGGRQFSTSQVRGLFNELLGEAKELQARYLPQIQERSRSLNVRELLPLVTKN